MTKAPEPAENADGTYARNGARNGARAKAGFNRAVLETSPAELGRQLTTSSSGTAASSS
jgi:hypothetical protein